MLLRRMVMAGFLAALGGGVAGGRDAWAQDVALPEPATNPPAQARQNSSEPELVMEGEVDRDIDLSKVVLSAAKGVTTVQEAPSIITIEMPAGHRRRARRARRDRRCRSAHRRSPGQPPVRRR